MYEYLLIAITSLNSSYGNHVSFQRFETKKECQQAALFIKQTVEESKTACLSVKNKQH